MKERPALMSAPMVRATMREIDPKTQTRRTQGLEHFSQNDPANWRCVRIEGGIAYFVYKNSPVERAAKCPYGQSGDRLWVRENGWERPERTPKMLREGADTWAPYYYDADQWNEQDFANFKAWGFKRRPSIHMPRWASRITLEVTGVRVERLQDISWDDALAEGLDTVCDGNTPYGVKGIARTWNRDPRKSYAELWESINGTGSWVTNPWVWVVEFKRLSPNKSADHVQQLSQRPVTQIDFVVQ